MSSIQDIHNRVSRREFLKISGLIGATIAGGGLLSSCAQKEEQVQLTHFIWVGGGQDVVPKEVIPAYTKEHPNVKIELYEGTNSVTYPKMVAAKQADPNKPLINFGFFNITATVKGAKDDMWVSLDPKKIPNMNDVYPAYHRPDEKGVAWSIDAMVIMYNKDLVKDPPTSWLDLLDPKYKGKVVTFDYPFDLMLVPIAHALGGDAKHVEEAFRLISEAAANGQFLAFGSSNDDVKNPIVRGEALIAPWYAGLAIPWAREGAPLDYAIPKEGQGSFPVYYQIVKGSTDKQIEIASEIINIYLSPEVETRNCELTSGIPTSSKAILSDETKNAPAFQKENVEKAIQLDWDTMAEMDAEWRKRWDREVKAVMT